jgi:hypothetical protein
MQSFNTEDILLRSGNFISNLITSCICHSVIKFPARKINNIRIKNYSSVETLCGLPSASQKEQRSTVTVESISVHKTQLSTLLLWPWKQASTFTVPLAYFPKYCFSVFLLWNSIVSDIARSTFIHCSSHNYDISSKWNVTQRYNTLWLTHVQNLQSSWVLLRMVKKGKAVPLQAWSGPEGSSKLRFPDFLTTAQDGGKVVSLKHRPNLPPGNTPGTHFC